MKVVWHPLARGEHSSIADKRERAAIDHVVEKLESQGILLGAPHSSDVRGTKKGKHAKKDGLRELRPRSGNCAWRPLYRRVGEVMVIAAVAPEYDVDGREYDKSVERAQERLAELENTK